MAGMKVGRIAGGPRARSHRTRRWILSCTKTGTHLPTEAFTQQCKQHKRIWFCLNWIFGDIGKWEHNHGIVARGVTLRIGEGFRAPMPPTTGQTTIGQGRRNMDPGKHGGHNSVKLTTLTTSEVGMLQKFLWSESWQNKKMFILSPNKMESLQVQRIET